MVDKKDVDIFFEYRDRIINAPEQKIVTAIDSIKWSFKIFYGNYIELIKPLKVIEEKPESNKLWYLKNKADLYGLFEEIGRLLFNYLAATFMLIDHTRRYVNKMYEDKKYEVFKQEYDKEIKERFAENGNHQIAQGLRTYMQHRNLPSVGSTISFTPESVWNKTFWVSVESLLDWDGWSVLAEKKLRAMGDSFQITRFVEEYTRQIGEFHEWLWGKQLELHGQDYERLNRLREEARKFGMDAGIITEEELKNYS